MDLFIAGLAAIFTIAGGIIGFFQEDDRKLKWWILLLPILGAVISFCTNYKSSKDANRFQDTLRKRDSANKYLLAKNLKSAVKIIDSLDVAVRNSRSLINQNNAILGSQNSSLKLLDRQFVATGKLQENIISSGKKLVRQIDVTKESLDNALTGGEGFCDLTFVRLGTGLFVLTATNLFNHTIPDIVFQITNYSKLLNCPKKFQNGNYEYDVNCFLENSVNDGPILMAPNVPKYLLNTTSLIDTSKKINKLIVKIETQKNVFFEQIIYQVIDGQHLSFIYRMLKMINGKEVVIKTNELTSRSIINWNIEFPLPLVLPIAKL